MKRSIKLIRIKGINFKMHWSFLIIFVWIVAANAAGGFFWENIKWSLVFILLIALSILIHELAHYWMAKKMGLQASTITFLPVGGLSTYEGLPAGKRAEILTDITGPLANLIIAGILLPFIQNQTPIWDISNHFDVIHGSDILYKLHLVNLGLFFVNLIPAFPLDGGNVFRTFLSSRINYFEASKIVVITGKVIAAGFLVAGIIYLNLLLLVISLLIFSAGQSEEFAVHLQSLLKGVTFSQVTGYECDILTAQCTVKDAMANIMANPAREFLVMDSGIPIGFVPRWEIVNKASEREYEVTLKEIMKRNFTSFNANEEVEKKFKPLLGFPYKNFPVLDKEKFIGVTNLTRILEYLLLNRNDPREHKILKSLIKKA
ncbi:MAG: hypothetical protein KGM98_14660 [Bacteroidota bacterium]|nr:hypothetical protein [Bacteroidota bacterium]